MMPFAALRMRANGGASSDPYWANVVSLVHLDTDFTDQKGHLWSVGSAAISGAQSRFGGASARTNNTTRENSSTSSDWAFGTGDFTAECWARIDSAVPGPFLKAPFGNWVSNVGFCFFYNTAGRISWLSNGLGITSAGSVLSATTWHAIAYSRISGVGYLFVDGVLVASGADTQNITSTNSPRIGSNRAGTNDDFVGYVDEIRVTKGVGRYSAGYTPPSTPFPNS